MTALADSFNPDAGGSSTPNVLSIAIQPDGKILAGGSFGSIGDQTRNNIARVDGATGLADSFNPNATDSVQAIVRQPDGKILVGGRFFSFGGGSTIGGQTRNRIARLDPATGLADSFNPNADNFVYSIAVQADGRVLASGYFGTIGGQTRNNIARLDGTTGLADSFDPSADNPVYSIAMHDDGKILVGGSFTSVGGQTRRIFARLTNTAAALQNLAVTQTNVTWTRDGSSPQLERVTFESSTDSVNYTSLGSGTAAGSNWTLTGLSLPTGTNIYIRARGYYRGGQCEGSESITESVRNVFIPLTPTQVVSRKLHNGAPFDITLPLTGNAGIECRSGGVTSDYLLVLKLSQPGHFQRRIGNRRYRISERQQRQRVDNCYR